MCDDVTFLYVVASPLFLSSPAYQSFVRAYATYPAELKRVFHVRTLHLGHVAKSFALQEAPTRIGETAGKFARLEQRRKIGRDG